MPEYSFPPVVFVKTNTLTTQIDHIRSEFREFVSEPTGSKFQIEEAIDLYHSLETYFRILERNDIDVDAAFQKVRAKNQARKYYKTK